MTKYTAADLQGDWEFKILRSNTPAFGTAEVLRRVCAEEAEAGWTLVEKFDNQRLRFKRPVSARARDLNLGYDPYRTQYGISTGRFVTIVLIGALLGSALLVGAIIGIVSLFVPRPLR